MISALRSVRNILLNYWRYLQSRVQIVWGFAYCGASPRLHPSTQFLVIAYTSIQPQNVIGTLIQLLTTIGQTDDFQFPDLANFPPIANGGNFQNGPYPVQQQLTSPTNASSPTSAAPRTGEKRKVNSISGASSELGMDDGARVAAEEDKRRRNTAASARFRIKKKQREQALEKTAKEMTDKASKLETKVQQLEMENQWLKSLITEKNDVKDDFQELYEKFTKERSEDERSNAERTDGVGTLVEEDAAGSDEE